MIFLATNFGSQKLINTMSRSYKKTPGWVDYHKKKKLMKRLANKKVRKSTLIDDGGSYRKLFCSWYIVDYRFLIFNKREIDYHAYIK